MRALGQWHLELSSITHTFVLQHIKHLCFTLLERRRPVARFLAFEQSQASLVYGGKRKQGSFLHCVERSMGFRFTMEGSTQPLLGTE